MKNKGVWGLWAWSIWVTITLAWTLHLCLEMSGNTKQQEFKMVSVSCDLAYSHTIGPLEATATEEEYRGWSFFLPDRGIVTITKIEKDFYNRTTISVKGSKAAREAEILLLSPGAVKRIERKDNAG